MFHWCLLLVILLIILIKDFKNPLIEGIDRGEETDDEETTDSGATESDATADEATGQQGIDDGEGGIHTSDSVQDMDEDEIKDELRRIREENYSDAAGFEAMVKKGQCTDEGDSPNHHSCKIDDAKDNKPNVDIRYLNPGLNKLYDIQNYTYLSCPKRFQDTMDLLVNENLKPDPELYKMTLDPSIPDPSNFFKNKFSIGQYPGYTENNYLDRTRYLESDEPLPVNPDFFVTGGGTYA